MKQFFSLPIEKRKQKRFKFFPVSTGLEDIKPALYDTFHGKCAFCESVVPDDSFMSLDRFRPRTEAINLDGSVSPDHYWWLSYEWSNMYLVCTACNKLKGNRFPVEGARAEAGTGVDELRKERPLLLDPCVDYPEEHLLFDMRGMVASETKQGRTTIEVFNLNRTTLAVDRLAALTEMRLLWDEVFSRQKSVAAKLSNPEITSNFDSPTLPFLGMRRQFLKQWSQEVVHKQPRLRRKLQPFLTYKTTLSKMVEAAPPRAGKAALKKAFTNFNTFQAKQEKYSVSSGSGIEHYYSKTRLIEHIEIKNFKLIGSLSLSIPISTEQTGSWLVLLGENGTGKSTILQAIALALMGERHRERLKLDASKFVRYKCQSGHVKIHLTGSQEPIVLRFSKRSKKFNVTPKEPRVLLLGYGATRLLPKANNETEGQTLADGQAAKAENLFNPFIPLNDATGWLAELPEDDYDLVARGLKDLLLLREDETLVRENHGKSEIFVKAFNYRVSLSDLSDGYQSVVALTADIMSVMRLRWPTMGAAEGIVLVDEIDSHLHPTWKMQIISRLRQTFPRLQFIVSSHDPLTLRGLQASEVVVIKRDEKGLPIPLTELPSPKSLRVDQLLTSEFFGLNSTVDPDIDRMFKEYYELLGKAKLKTAEAKRLTDLKIQLDQNRQLGTTRRERLMLEAADNFLAEESHTADSSDRRQLKEQTKRKIAEMWKSVKPLSE